MDTPENPQGAQAGENAVMEITREEVEAEMTRRFKAANLVGKTVEEVKSIATNIATDMACEEKYAKFFAHLYQPNNYSVSCSSAPEDLKNGKLTVDIELSGPLAEQYLNNQYEQEVAGLRELVDKTQGWKND